MNKTKLIMIREASGPADDSYKVALWEGPLNNKARHYIRQLMSEHFESLYRKWPFIDRLDLVATIYDEMGDLVPVCLTYGGVIAGDQWQMYAGGYWRAPCMARWTRELSRDEMKMYLNSKYGRVVERNDVYFDYD